MYRYWSVKVPEASLGSLLHYTQLTSKFSMFQIFSRTKLWMMWVFFFLCVYREVEVDKQDIKPAYHGTHQTTLQAITTCLTYYIKGNIKVFNSFATRINKCHLDTGQRAKGNKLFITKSLITQFIKTYIIPKGAFSFWTFQRGP